MASMKIGELGRVSFSEAIHVSVIIPHFYTSRDEKVRKLLISLREQTYKDMEVIVVPGISPQGKAINEGARAARGEILMVMDDDSQIGHSRVVENLVRAIREDTSVAMAGASILTPGDANSFQKLAARQFPRFNMPVAKEMTK